jgi:DNA repair exonuclease SbcCD ATPase subunit
VIKEYRPVSTRYEVSSVNDDHIKYFLSQKMINPEMEQGLRKIIAQKNEIASLDSEAVSRKAQITSISENQQRVRENMKALKGSAEEKTLIERYARELNEQEDRVQALQKEISDLQAKHAIAQRTLNEMVEGLQMETTL